VISRPITRRNLSGIILGALFVFCFATLEIAAAHESRVSQSFETLSAKAEAARNADQLDQAMSFYKQALALRPTWAEGWFYLGTLHYDRNEFTTAAAAFRKVAALQPSSGTALVMLGLSEFQLGRDDMALKHLQAGEEQGISNNPELRNTVLLDEAILLQRKSRFEAARKPLDILCQNNAASDVATRLLGMIQLRLRADEAASASSEMLAQVGMAGCLAAQRRFDEARRIFTTVVSENPKFPEVHYAFGNLLLDIPDIAAARQEFEREIANQPDHVLARLKIASALYRTDSDAGIPFAEQAVKLAPKIGLGHYLLGLLLLDVDDFKRAIPELETAKSGFAKEPKLYFALGSAYSRAGRSQDAERARAEFQRLQKLQDEKDQLQKRRDEESQLNKQNPKSR
jgi:tetratricopeptide (TPR) repeat protein